MDQPQAIKNSGESSEPDGKPSPSEMRLFVSDLKEFFREIKKFVIFIRNKHNTNALLVALTFALAIATFTQAVIYGLQLEPLKDSASAAASSASTAASQLELAERPWVDADIMVEGPLLFNVNGANISLKLALRNTGHSPALSVGVFPLALIGHKSFVADSYRDQVCELADRVSTGGISLFPNTNFPQSLSTTIPQEDIANGKAPKEFPNSTFGDVIRSPSIVLCIAYRPTFKTNAIYHTTYVLDLFKVDSTGNISAMFKIGEDVDSKNLLLRFHSLNSISAN